jgi:hypothetical protein
MKTLKFSKNLIPSILSGEKTTTWRCFDDKDLKEGDEVLFLEHETKKPFAKVKLVEIKEKTFKELNEEDREGHEKFKNDEEMLKTYSEYYKTEITPDTPLKIIKFKILIKI